MINIWLDDIRPAPKGFIWVKTVNELINLVSKYYKDAYPKINIISLDNDLGENEPEGYKFLDHLEFMHYKFEIPLPNEIRVHSANAIARKRMNQIINKLYKKSY